MEVYELIKRKGADLVIHLGDFDYLDSPDRFERRVNELLGPDFPYFIVVGNHDLPAWAGPQGYQRRFQDRLARTAGRPGVPPGE